MKIIDYLDILLIKLIIRRLKSGYGADCPTSDLDDFPETYKKPKDVFNLGRCGSCRAKEVIEWLEEHINLIRL